MKRSIRLLVIFLFIVGMSIQTYGSVSPNPTLNYVDKDIAFDSRGNYYVANSYPYIQAPVDRDGNFGFSQNITESNFKALMIDGTFIPQAVVITENGRTLIPARIVSENLNAHVSWDGNTKSVTITKDDTKIVMTENNSFAFLNGIAISLDAPVKIYNGLTYVPIRFIAESLDSKVGYTVIKQESEINDYLPLTIVWIDSKEFSNIPKISNFDALKSVREFVLADIEANYHSHAKFLVENRLVPGHFDEKHVFRLLKEMTASAQVYAEFSCYVAIGNPNILYNKITKNIYVYDNGATSIKIGDYSISGYLSSFNLQ